MPSAKGVGDKYENDLHVRAAVYLTHVLPKAPSRAVWWHTPNGARYDPAKARSTAGLMAMMGLLPGIPDILILYRSRLHGFDLKSIRGTATKSQIETASDLSAGGALILDPKTSPVRTIEDIEAALIGWGIPLNFSYTELKTKNIMRPHEARAMSAIGTADKGLKARRAVRLRRKASAKFSQPSG
jgi:hypothetical protein